VNREYVTELVRAHYEGDDKRFGVIAAQLADAEDTLPGGSAEVALRLRESIQVQECDAEEDLECVRDGVAVTIVLNCCLRHASPDDAHYDNEFHLFWYKLSDSVIH
jgi:hypothetical protein